jgi:hypothetical protein
MTADFVSMTDEEDGDHAVIDAIDAATSAASGSASSSTITKFRTMDDTVVCVQFHGHSIPEVYPWFSDGIPTSLEAEGFTPETWADVWIYLAGFARRRTALVDNRGVGRGLLLCILFYTPLILACSSFLYQKAVYPGVIAACLLAGVIAGLFIALYRPGASYPQDFDSVIHQECQRLSQGLTYYRLEYCQEKGEARKIAPKDQFQHFLHVVCPAWMDRMCSKHHLVVDMRPVYGVIAFVPRSGQATQRAIIEIV